MFNEKKLVEAAKLIKDYCDHTVCQKCIFNCDGGCMFAYDCDSYASEYIPCNWDTSAIRGSE